MFANFDWIGAVRSSPVMMIILGCSVLVLGFIIERSIYFWKRRGNPDAVLGAALIGVRGGDTRGALHALASTPHPFGRAGTTVLENAQQPPDVIEEQLAITLSAERLSFERNLGVLGTMGNTTPLVGLLGTVWGIMRAFHDMAATGSAGPSVVAAGVAEALLTTAAGLVVAVPAVIFYNHFARQTTVMLTVAENHARTLRLAHEAEVATRERRPEPGRPTLHPIERAA